ncbi:MAG: Na/Pi symporter [Acidimicrobiales bacterium]|nr:Na/Pi symporter [Acidimicrobiales bacterium]
MGDQEAIGTAGGLPSSARRILRLVLVLGALYLFLAAISSLETGIGMLGENLVDQVFSAVANPLTGLAAGLLATVLVQSSSATTSIIVGLVGAGVLTVEAAVPMVMGANIGSAVTSTLASLGHIRQGVYFERGFAAATMQDFYNILAVVIFLPLELAFGAISKAARGLAGLVTTWGSDSGPSEGGGGLSLGDIVDAPVDALANLLNGWGLGTAAGPVMIALGLAALVVALILVTRLMKQLVSTRMELAVNSILSKRGGFMAVLAGLFMTLAVQSSGITNSIMVPLVAAGVLSMPNAFPVILGADLGTTATAVLASVAASSPEALVIAMAHVVINFAGIFVFYPMKVRQVPIRMAQWLSKTAVANKTWVAVYIITVFVAAPVLILILS